MRNGFQTTAVLIILQIIHFCFPSTSYSQSIRLTWRANPEPDTKYYGIFKATVSNPTAEITQVPASDTTYLDKDIALGNIYYYRITAVDSAGNVSEFSDEIMVAADIATPVELSAFSAQFLDDKVVLKWITATETNNYGFEIERSPGKDDFEKIGFVGGNGTVTMPQSYTFVDADISAGKYFYRLKQIDLDGSFEYSDTIAINVGVPERFELSTNYPNPFNPETTFYYNVANDTKISLTVYDILGRKVKTLIEEFKKPGRYSITWDGTDNLSRKVASGAYFVRFVADNFGQVRKVLLQK